MKFPSIRDVARELRGINMNVEGECDVRLQVWPDGEWRVRWGDASYDTDHRGFWGASSVPGVNGGRVSRFNSRDTARDLLAQAKASVPNAGDAAKSWTPRLRGKQGTSSRAFTAEHAKQSSTGDFALRSERLRHTSALAWEVRTMYTAEIQSLIVRFWGEFSVSPLYDTGYGEPVATGGLLHLSQTRDDLLRGLAYMKGYADACRLACPYKSRGWEIAQIVGLAASVLYTTVSASGETTAEHVTSLCDRYRRELIALLEKEDDASTYRLGLALASPIGGTR